MEDGEWERAQRRRRGAIPKRQASRPTKRTLSASLHEFYSVLDLGTLTGSW